MAGSRSPRGGNRPGAGFRRRSRRRRAACAVPARKTRLGSWKPALATTGLRQPLLAISSASAAAREDRAASAAPRRRARAIYMHSAADAGAHERALRPFHVIEAPGVEAEDRRGRRERPGEPAELAAHIDQRDDRRRPAAPRRRSATSRCSATRCGFSDSARRSIVARDQDRDRRIERQHVVRQLGDDELEHDPARHEPGEQEAQSAARAAAATPQAPRSRRAARPARR